MSRDQVAFRLSPDPAEHHAAPTTATPSTSAADDYNLVDRPWPGLSRAELVPYLLDNLDKAGDVCREPDCPYNLWLYADHRFPTKTRLADWEGRSFDPAPDFSIPRVKLVGSTAASDSRAESPGLVVGDEADCSRSTASKRSTVLPSYSEATSAASHSLSLPPFSHLEDSVYPIVTLPKGKRVSLTSLRLSSGLCCIPAISTTSSRKQQESLEVYAMTPSKPAPRPLSSSSCSCSTHSSSSSPSSSCSCCSSAIPEPVDPTAPHAFTVPDTRKAGGQGRGQATSRRTGRWWWEGEVCTTACCVSFAFILFCVVGLACLLLYLYFNTTAMHEGMTTS